MDHFVGRDPLASCFLFIEALDVKYCGVDSPQRWFWKGPILESQFILKTQARTVRAGTSAIRTMDPPARLYVSDTNVLNTKTQANVAGYNWFSMLLQYNMNIFTTYNSPLHRVFKCFWTMGGGSPAAGCNHVKSPLMKSVNNHRRRERRRRAPAASSVI